MTKEQKRLASLTAEQLQQEAIDTLEGNAAANGVDDIPPDVVPDAVLTDDTDTADGPLPGVYQIDSGNTAGQQAAVCEGYFLATKKESRGKHATDKSNARFWFLTIADDTYDQIVEHLGSVVAYDDDDCTVTLTQAVAATKTEVARPAVTFNVGSLLSKLSASKTGAEFRKILSDSLLALNDNKPVTGRLFGSDTNPGWISVTNAFDAVLAASNCIAVLPLRASVAGGQETGGILSRKGRQAATVTPMKNVGKSKAGSGLAGLMAKLVAGK